MQHDIQTLIRLFDDTFAASENTRLICCEPEPIYRPADAACPYHRIVFAHGFFASALHEIAHWCIAGPQRRLLEDYGYWYKPDGRSADEQAEFERVEVKPQALEWIFSASADFHFHFSADNLSGGIGPSQAFKQAVHAQVIHYLDHGLPDRAARWSKALLQHYRPHRPLQKEEFTLNGR